MLDKANIAVENMNEGKWYMLDGEGSKRVSFFIANVLAGTVMISGVGRQ